MFVYIYIEKACGAIANLLTLLFCEEESGTERGYEEWFILL